jgi:hypothetical protein
VNESGDLQKLKLIELKDFSFEAAKAALDVAFEYRVPLRRLLTKRRPEFLTL